jgi:uncharacterized circularly permuted ATP-grasp superfamily protein/uncharacterized alpha-E superfamily protein
MSIFDKYKKESSFDEMFDKEQNIKEHWVDIAKKLENAGLEKLEQKQTEIDWRLEDNGVTYNIYNDPEGNNRRWNLDPIPFVLKKEEWDEITKGLKQRAKLLNLIFKDLYTEQKLIKDGIVPAEIIFAHSNYLTSVFNFKNEDYYNMKYYATDISRGPDGKFWVTGDRTQSPSGLGYAIENRLTMNSIITDLYPKVKIHKIANFVEGFKNSLKSFASQKTENPLITLLTPGPYNETYFEHSYLSSFLNLTLVQGQDLLVKNNQLWLKTLSGLKKVDAMLRRVDSPYCDPLELRSDSYLGVAGLVNVLRNDQLSMVNPIGVGILENLGLNPFMNNLCKYFLDEELILPQIATWWCGQKKELDFVLKHLENLIIKRVDKSIKSKTYIGNKLSKTQLEDLKKEILKNPNQYVGQEIIDFSTVPSYEKGKIEPRNAVIRTFAYQHEDGYEILPSGLVRVSSKKDELVVSNQSGGTSKDLWILGEDKEQEVKTIFKEKDFIDSRLENITTKRAENLFWLGRYLERAITTARMLRFNLKSLLNANRYEESNYAENTNNILNKCLTHLTMTYPGFLEENEEIHAFKEIVSVIKDENRAGSLSFTLMMLSNVNANIKNLLTMEAWRIFERMTKEWNKHKKNEFTSSREEINQLDKLLIYLMAYKELIDESIFKEQGLIIFDIGVKIETSQLLISKLRSLLTSKYDTLMQYDILDSMLNSYESYNSYRAHYQSTVNLENVIEFLLFNNKYPKSLIYIINNLQESLDELPNNHKNSQLSNYEEPIFKIYTKLKLTNIPKLISIGKEDAIYKNLDKFLSQIDDLLSSTSEELTKTYFSHYNE